MEKWKKSFSHNLPIGIREDVAQWIKDIRYYDLPEDEPRLRWCGIQWFTALGHTPMHDREARGLIGARLAVIDRQRARNKAKEQCTISADSV